MKVFVTGIGGFLGGAIASDLRARGNDVDGSRRGTPLTPETFEGVEVVIHLAHDFTRGAAAHNIDGTAAWFSAARARGVRQQVFLSSCSAGPESEYGRIKAAIEPMFLDAGQCVVRPGLVMGEGGLFARQRQAILRSPVIPMIGGGVQPTAVIGIDEFLAAMRRIVERDLRGSYSLYRMPMPSYREFVSEIKQAAGQKARFVNVPTGLALAVTRGLERVGLPFPIKSGQIRALTAGPGSKSDLEALNAS
jgi:nucleoside-diphosphate-sugar epimerase